MSTAPRQLAVLGDQVVSVRALDDDERRELSHAARMKLLGISLFAAVLVGTSGLVIWTRSPLAWLLLLPFVFRVPWDLRDAWMAFHLLADRRRGQVLIFASAAGRAERLASSGTAWSNPRGKVAWRSS